MRVRVLLAPLLAMLLLALTASGAQADGTPPRTGPSLKLSTTSTVNTGADGVQHYHYAYGPIRISPGQNSIFTEVNRLKPPVAGYITRFSPNLVEGDGSIPPVDKIHLHHAVWRMNGVATFAAGEEKTIVTMSPGYGFPSKPSDVWQMNHMIHDLVPSPATIYITYDLDFVPLSSPAAATIVPVAPRLLDVMGGIGYPVFDAVRGAGHGPSATRQYTYPDDEPKARVFRWTVDHDQTLVATGGHLHPGGLYTDLKITRGAQTKLLFRSTAKYWEPAGAVSWDVAMTVSPPDWKINVRAGDIISVSGTYDTARASWYESMAIMSTQVAEGWHGVDPFTAAYPTTGEVTHGPLAENRNHGGRPGGLPDPFELLDGPVLSGTTLRVKDFVFGPSDLAGLGRRTGVPVVTAGRSLTFRNDDAPRSVVGSYGGPDEGQRQPIYHTITACKAPCNRSTGIAYPLADGAGDYDSGELGYGGPPSAGRNTWKTPKTLKPGTYTYFCRVHPFMRGAFRVIKKARTRT